MQVKTILNRVQRQRSFVYGPVRLVQGAQLSLEVEVRPRANARAKCSGCGGSAPGYDTLSARRFEFVPLWGIAVFLVYAMRRVACSSCGVKVERVALCAFVWDVTVTGAKPEEVAERAAKVTAPAPGSVRVHNESESWAALAPELGGRDLGETSRLFRNHLLGGLAIPEHWFGGGGDVNRATAAEMGDPAFKTLKVRQRLWSEILRRAAEYALARRLDPEGRIWPDPADPELAVSVEWPEMVVADASRHASALAQTAGAVGLAIDRGLLTEATALRILAAVAGRLGVELDVGAELEAAREEAAGRAEADGFPQSPDDGDG